MSLAQCRLLIKLLSDPYVRITSFAVAGRACQKKGWCTSDGWCWTLTEAGRLALKEQFPEAIAFCEQNQRLLQLTRDLQAQLEEGCVHEVARSR